MSDLLALATTLRNHTDEQLIELLARRTVIGTVVDFLDLAQALLQPKSIAECIRKLSAAEVRALDAALAADSALPEQSASQLKLLGLAIQTANGTQVPELVAENYRQILSEVAKTTATGDADTTSTDAKPFAPCSQAAVTFFETQQAITELILDVEQNQIRLVGKSGIGIGDVKRLANQLRSTNDRAKVFYRTAIGLRLIQLAGKRWWLTPAAEDWLSSTPQQRFARLAEYWLATLGRVGVEQLASLLKTGESDLRVLLAQVFPLANHKLDEHLADLRELSEAIGLAIGATATDLLPPVVAGDWAKAEKLLGQNLPNTTSNLIVQADLSIVAPGPLETALELKIRSFATVEQIGLASSYRLSPASLSHALECGGDIGEIRALLAKLNDKALPQPVEYLLNEAEKRFGRLRIAEGAGEERSQIKSTDALLLTEILNDTRLRPYALKPTNAATLASRFDPEVIYFGLRELGYVAVLVDASGNVRAPRNHKSWGELDGHAESNGMKAMVEALRASDQRIGEEPDDQDLVRQLQLAIKTKSPLQVTLTDRNGQEVEFRILPTSLANGRLRGLDRKADAERTLPLERILRIAY